MRNTERMVELDVFRGLAALAVLLFHYTTRYDQIYGHPQLLLFEFPFGHYGVQFFFMVSGFVIFMTLNKTKKYPDFLISRFSRLYPVYWMAIVVTLGFFYTLGLPGREIGWSEIVANLTMMQGFFGVQDIDGAYWTLKYELIFYALMLAVFLTGKMTKIELVCGIWLFIQLSSNILESIYGYFPWKIKLFLLLEYCHLFVGGIVFYQCQQEGFNVSRSLLLLFSLLEQCLVGGGVSCGIVATFYLIFYLFCCDLLHFVRIRPLQYLGKISYSLYLVHQTVSYTIFQKLYPLGFGQIYVFGFSFLVVLILSHFLTFYVEQPAMLRIRNWYKG